MTWFRVWCLAALSWAFFRPAVAASSDDRGASQVVILANASDRDSLRIARQYAAARGVPAANIFALPLPSAETIEWRDFLAELWHPLLAELVRTGWIDAVPMRLTDLVGRTKYAPHAHRITALVVCRGVPLRIAHDPGRMPLPSSPSAPPAAREAAATNAGAVDSELSLLASPNYPIQGFVPNPLFHRSRPGRLELDQVIRVSRLDGPTVADAMALVDRALEAEHAGLRGRAYVDLADREPRGNRWFEAVLAQLRAEHFPVDSDPAPSPFPPGARFDAPVLYFGWYAADACGPFTLPGFRFPSGAIAYHLHSFSAATVRSATAGWVGPLVARGVTATMGNVYEPFLTFCHRPDLFLQRLRAGDTLVEAAYFALPVLSWQQVLIGDPLYRPFPAGRREPAASGGYAALQRMQVLIDARRPDEAEAVAEAAGRIQPDLAVALGLARLRCDRGDREGAARALALRPGPLAADQWGLAREVAVLLAELGQPGPAVEFWRTLFRQPLPDTLRQAWLAQAAEVAAAAGEESLAAEWRRSVVNGR